MRRLDTAHRAWDESWKSPDGRARWLKPEPDVERWARQAREKGAKTALDLGCGVGRHALLLAELGFETCAMDASETGIGHVRDTAHQLGLDIDARLGEMTALPYDDDHFDYVLSFHVIYHGDRQIVQRAISEIQRVLKSGGLYQGTMLSKRNDRYGVGTEIAPETFADESDTTGDKSHPHFFCNAAELVDLFGGFQLLSLNDVELNGPGTWHWLMVAEYLSGDLASAR